MAAHEDQRLSWPRPTAAASLRPALKRAAEGYDLIGVDPRFLGESSPCQEHGDNPELLPHAWPGTWT